jgi:CRP/FNR family transcriptional regulator, cyclic AMP receptor protein
MDHTPEQSVEKFFADFTPLHYKKSEVILRAEDIPSGVYFLKKGYVRQYAVSPKGDTLFLHVYKPGSYFPMPWLINDIPNTFYYESLTPVEMWRAPKEQTQAFLDANPQVLIHFTKRFLTGVNGLLARIQHLVFDSAYDRTVSLIVYFARSFGEESKNGQILIRMPFVHKDVASWIGSTRETASLQMELLRKKGLIEYTRRQLTVKNMARLEAEIGKGK